MDKEHPNACKSQGSKQISKLGGSQFPGGPVWDEYKITNEEMHVMTPCGERMTDEEEIGKYGRKIKVKTYPRQWRQHRCQSKDETGVKYTKTWDDSCANDPYDDQSWSYDETWEDRRQK